MASRTLLLGWIEGKFSPLQGTLEPASVGLKNSPRWSKLDADCNCRPWSKSSMNSLPCQRNEQIAPASCTHATISILESASPPLMDPAGSLGTAAMMPVPWAIELPRGAEAALTPATPMLQPANARIVRRRALRRSSITNFVFILSSGWINFSGILPRLRHPTASEENSGT